MIRLAFSTNAFKKNTLEQAIDAIADVGYRGVELMADLPHAYPPDMPPQRRQAVRKQIADRGLAAMTRALQLHISFPSHEIAHVRLSAAHSLLPDFGLKSNIVLCAFVRYVCQHLGEI